MIKKSVALREAYNDTWIYEGHEREVYALSEKYGRLDAQALRQIAQEEQGKEKVFALFALCYAYALYDFRTSGSAIYHETVLLFIW